VKNFERERDFIRVFVQRKHTAKRKLASTVQVAR
jgi:hypothetical protein